MSEPSTWDASLPAAGLALDAPRHVPLPDVRAVHGPSRGKASDGASRAIVIGSGFGGLAAAIRLGARGYRVTVLERLPTCGGRAAVHRQDGFTFDAGPTIVTAPHLFEELWQMCGRRMSDDITLRALDPFYHLRFDDGSVFHYSGGAALRAEIARFSPHDVEGFDRLMALSKEIFDLAFLRLGHRSFGSWWEMLRALPSLLRLRGHESIYALVSRYLSDPRLRVAFSFHPLLVGGNPFTTTSVYALISHLEQKWGVHYVMGGTGELVRGMESLIAHQGNHVRCDAEVTEIQNDGRRVRGVKLANGEQLPAEVVVSNADAMWTYAKMLPGHKAKRWTPRRIARAHYSMGLFVWYFGTRRQYAEQPHHMILLGPRYRELLADIFKHRRLAEDFSLYLHRPTATDPAMAPPGCDAFYVLSPVPHLGSGIDWRVQAEPYRRAIAQALSDTVLPNLETELVTSKVTTPADFETRYLSVHGAAFGLEPRLMQSAWFRPHNRSEELEGLYLVGAGTHPGAGLPGVLSSARVLDAVVPAATTELPAHA